VVGSMDERVECYLDNSVLLLVTRDSVAAGCCAGPGGEPAMRRRQGLGFSALPLSMSAVAVENEVLLLKLSPWFTSNVQINSGSRQTVFRPLSLGIHKRLGGKMQKSFCFDLNPIRWIFMNYVQRRNVIRLTVQSCLSRVNS